MASSQPPSKSPLTSGRTATLALVLIAGVSVVGFFLGLKSGLPDSRAVLPVTEPVGVRVKPATPWQEIHDASLGPNSGWQTHLAMASATEDLPPPSEEERQSARQRRSHNRAYDGAPPTIPHRIDNMPLAACVQCHGDGLMVGSQVRAPQMSHKTLANCTQCHVTQQPQAPEVKAYAAEADRNAFMGLGIATQGERASPVAPPTIPHRTLMRENCSSCHGPSGRNAIRTSHPWRQSCTQCHAPNAEWDQRPGGGVGLDLLLPPEE